MWSTCCRSCAEAFLLSLVDRLFAAVHVRANTPLGCLFQIFSAAPGEWYKTYIFLKAPTKPCTPPYRLPPHTRAPSLQAPCISPSPPTETVSRDKASLTDLCAIPISPGAANRLIEPITRNAMSRPAQQGRRHERNTSIKHARKRAGDTKCQPAIRFWRSRKPSFLTPA